VHNGTTSEVTPQWTNDDGSIVNANIGYVNAAFVLTGDKTTFENTWEDSVEWIVSPFASPSFYRLLSDLRADPHL
jgi:hypothetical protein